MDDNQNFLSAILAAAALIGLFSVAHAEPYLQTPASLRAVQLQSGFALDPLGKHGKEGFLAAAVAFHAPKEPTLTDPAWAPVTLGFSGKTWSELHLLVGPSINLLPQLQALLYEGLDAAFPDSFDNLKDSLTPADPSKLDSGLCIGYLLEVIPSQDWNSRGVVFAGGWLKYGGGVLSK